MEKKLIIHMDDIGVNLGANLAAMELFERQTASSASVMIPCAWAYDFIKWSIKNPQYDIGIHGTHTCEWNVSRWRSMAARELQSEDGFMPQTVEALTDLSPQQYLLELETQISTALEWGLTPSHLDNHMWTARVKPEFLKAHVELARKYHLIPNVPKWLDASKQNWIRPQELSFPQEGTLEQRADKVLHLLKEGKEDLYLLTVHPSLDTPEVRAMIPGWKERYEEYLLLRDEGFKRKLDSLGVQLVSWKDAISMEFSAKQEE